MTDTSATIEPSDPAAQGGVRAWLQLVRLPAVFTALADIAAGYTCQTGAFQPVGEFAALLTASASLYLAGMVFNDVFDRRRDAIGRPGRPIPSGRISTKSAAIVGAVLVAIGIASAASVSSQALWIALGLTAGIFAYDGFLKHTPLGPVAMGGCRFLNVMLGAAGDDGAAFVWEPPQLIVAAAIGIYVAGITWFARTEETTSRRGLLLGGAAVANLGMALLACLYYGWPPALTGFVRGDLPGTAVAIIVVAIALTVNRRVAGAISSPTPDRVQDTVKLMLLSIITLDATTVLAQTGDVSLALATALLVLPALVIGRWVYVT
ncbi:MAG: UbiA family prenyltransferase [Planctomycetaceae bacterium]